LEKGEGLSIPRKEKKERGRNRNPKIDIQRGENDRIRRSSRREKKEGEKELLLSERGGGKDAFIQWKGAKGAVSIGGDEYDDFYEGGKRGKRKSSKSCRGKGGRRIYY